MSGQASEMSSSVEGQQRPLAFPEALLGVFIRPVRTLRALTHQPRLGWALAVIVASLGLEGLWQGFTWPPEDFYLDLTTGVSRVVYVAGWTLVMPLLGLTIMAVVTGLFQGMSRVSGGKGSFAGLFTALTFGSVVYLLSLPFSAYAVSIRPVATSLNEYVEFALYGWMFLLWTIGFRENNRFSWPRAVVGVVLLPTFLVVGLTIIFIVAVAIVA